MGFRAFFRRPNARKRRDHQLACAGTAHETQPSSALRKQIEASAIAEYPHVHMLLSPMMMIMTEEVGCKKVGDASVSRVCRLYGGL